MIGLSDHTLGRLWRLAVLIEWDNKCAFCGQTNVNLLQCHHIIRRRHKYLRHQIYNGISLCGSECHPSAHTRLGEARIIDLIGDEKWQRLCNEEQIKIKDWLQENGLSKTEWLTQVKQILIDSLKERQ